LAQRSPSSAAKWDSVLIMVLVVLIGKIPVASDAICVN
jgi:hypothetical protein